MKISSVWKEVASMLYWSMLAACTVGPGTVVTCARAGAEYGFNLIWALIFASILAFTLQEGTARLTIVSGKSLGQCLRVKYRHGPKIVGTAVVCWAVAISVFLGNTLYECNNWAGGIDAVFALPSEYWPYVTPEGVAGTWWRVGCCIAYGVVVLALLYADKVDMLGMFLGFVMISMIALFFVIICFMDLDFAALVQGFIPNIPSKSSEGSAEPTDIILSLVGTTSLGFNLFLGGSMAKGKKLGSAQRGIAFSTISALEVSSLILIVGAGTRQLETGEPRGFSVSRLAELIQEYISVVGVYIFSFGFIAAALSSMLAVPLGAGLTCDSVFGQCEEEVEDDVEVNEGLTSGEENKDEKIPQQESDTKEGVPSDEIPSSPTKLVPKEEQAPKKDHTNLKMEEKRILKTLPRPVYWGLMTLMVIIAVVVISCNVPRVHVILVAQVFNGCLLPFFAILLLICLNDQQFMGKCPQPGWANIFLFITVTICLFLTSNVLIQKIFGAFLTTVVIKLVISLFVSLGVIATLCISTSLGKDLIRSFSSVRRLQVQ